MCIYLAFDHAFHFLLFKILGSVPVLVDDRSQQIFDIDKFGNITFTCTMKGQAGILIDWYRKGVIIRESKIFKIQSEDLGDNHMQSKLSLYNVTIDENGVKYECQGRYPNVSRYTSYAVLLRVGGRYISSCPVLSSYLPTTIAD